MLDKHNIQAQIKQNAALIQGFGIAKIGLFGSYIRKEQKPDSDIDILIDFEKDEETFDNLMGVSLLLDSIFKGYKVEVVTVNGLSPYIGPHILKNVEYVQIAH